MNGISADVPHARYMYVLLQAPGAKPVVKSLLEEGEELKVIENHFAIPVSLLFSALHVVPLTYFTREGSTAINLYLFLRIVAPTSYRDRSPFQSP